MSAKYGVIVADPPWKYGGTNQHQGRTRRAQVLGRFNGAARNRYPSMHTAAIAALPVAALAADPCVLLLWATWPTLPEALKVLDGWGFEYVTALPWIKVLGAPRHAIFGRRRWTPQYGIGFWVRSCSEPLLIARRGKISIRSPYLGLLSENFGHSRKPDNVYQYAEQFAGPRLELFARRPWPGWDAMGDGISGLDIREEFAALAAD